MDNDLTKAVKAEEAENYQLAFDLYNKIVSSKLPPVEAYINLSFLYFIFSTEPFFIEKNELTEETWAEIRNSKYSIVLSKALTNYPNNMELHFWNLYFPNRVYQEPFPKEKCLELIQSFKDTPSLIPYFYLDTFSEGSYSNEVRALVRQCKSTKTAKNKYILSIVGSVSK